MPPPAPCPAVLLAAGGSTRMGTPKGLLDVDGTPLVCRQAEAFLACAPELTIVLGAHAEQYRAALALRFRAEPRLRLVFNPRWATTSMADSLRMALTEGPALVSPVDVPPARAATLRRLQELRVDAVPVHAGLPGHPVRLGSPLEPGQRLDQRLAAAERVVVDDPDCLLNLNTPEAWAEWLSGRRVRGWS